MHKGEFEGTKAKKQPKRILILGESHHINSDENSPNHTLGVEATYETKEVVQDRYLKSYNASMDDRDPAYRFFDQIVRAFGIDPEKGRTDFWDKVYFGNYINVLCGVRECTATNLLKEKENREEYNNKLFSFINENEIDVVFCFSRRVYNKLPSLVKDTDENEKTINVGDFLRTKDGKPKKDYISYCKYLPGFHGYTTKPLKRTVEVYGMLHPSGRYGFAPENYAPELKKQISF